MPSAYGRYPSRAQVVEYLESYAAKFDLKPRLNAPVSQVRRSGTLWRAEAGDETVEAPVAVIATGFADFPNSPVWPGMETFGGPILHSSRYRNPVPFAGQRVLVVGFGNSGGEIALDLAEARVDATLSIRGPVRILPRELFGVPILTWAIAQQRLPARIADILNAPAIRLAVGSIEKLGMTRAAKGPRRMVEEDGRVPLLDIGTVAPDPRRADQGKGRHREPWAEDRRRSQALSRSPSTRSFWRPAFARTCANCCRTRAAS